MVAGLVGLAVQQDCPVEGVSVVLAVVVLLGGLGMLVEPLVVVPLVLYVI